MDLSPLGLTAAVLPSPLPARRMQVSSGALLTACKLAKEQVALVDADGLSVLEHTLPDEGGQYSDIAAIFPAANRMERAAFDLVGVASDADDQRPWLWLASWPIDRFPLR